MSSSDKKVINGIVVSPDNQIKGGVAIKNGRIVAVGADDSLPDADEIIDAKGNYIIPGVIDNHGHPGGKYPLSTDLRTETPGAAAGGVTTWGCSVRPPRMGQELDPKKFPGKPEEIPTPEDAVSYHEVFHLGKRAGEENSIVDFFFDYSLCTMQHGHEIPEYAKEHKVYGFKLFGNLKTSMDSPVSPQWHARIGIPTPFDDSLFYLTFEQVGKLGPPAKCIVHNENTEVCKLFQERLQAQNRKDIAAWHERSPGFLEAEHLRRYGYFAEITGGTMYVYHLTSIEGLEECRKLKANLNVSVTVETCPQYLVRSVEDKPHGNGLLLKVNPPIRPKEHAEALWEGIRDGTIDCIGTDHVVTSLHEKFKKGDTSDHKGDPSKDVWECGSGFVGVEFLLPLMLSEGVNKGRISFERMVETMCANTARSTGIYPRKGTLQVGSDADLVIVDMNKKKTVDGSNQRSLADFSVYHGMELQGWPILTMLRGEVIFKDDKVTGSHEYGEYIPRLVD